MTIPGRVEYFGRIWAPGRLQILDFGAWRLGFQCKGFAAQDFSLTNSGLGAQAPGTKLMQQKRPAVDRRKRGQGMESGLVNLQNLSGTMESQMENWVNMKWNWCYRGDYRL